jgi:tRNA nucleotidyltransferase (CCA-adding enzyme)
MRLIFKIIHNLIIPKQLNVQKCFLSSTLISNTKDKVLKIYDLKTPLFKKVLTNELLYLSSLFEKNNFKLRIAGGPVRDLLLDIEPYDIDLATDALPEQMIQMFKKENVRIINLKGIKHGTLPIRINEVSPK